FQRIFNALNEIIDILNFLLARTRNYIELTDTNPSYVTHARNVPVVNLSETALEFGPMVVPPPRGFFGTNNIIFNGTAPTSYTDLDATVDTSAAATGLSGPAWAFMKVDCAAGASIEFIKNGDTAANHEGNSLGVCVTDNTNQITYVMMLTDGNGLLEWKSSSATAVTITLLGFLNSVPIPGDLIFDASLTQAYQVVNTGYPNALCLLKVESNNASGLNSCDVKANWEALNGSGGGMQFCNPGDGKFAYVMAPSDGAGNIQIRNDNASSRAAKVYLTSYIPKVRQPRTWLHYGTYEADTWFDIPTTFGQAMALVRFEHNTGGGGQQMRWRVNGESSTSKYNGGGAMWETGTVGEFSYALVITDQSGVFEFESNDAAATIYLSAEALIE
ncbi:hypothetical protein LCGC14_2758870, partial [marine sediment metagenome]